MSACTACGVDLDAYRDEVTRLNAALDAAQDEIEKLLSEKEELRERLEWEQPEPDGDIIQVTDHTGPEQDYDTEPATWDRVIGEFPPGMSEWKGYKNGGKIYLDWPELVRRWGPLTATMWERSCDGSLVGCPLGEHSHTGGVGRGLSS